MKLPRILYFINNVNPTDDEVEAAAKIRGNVSFRNARNIPEDGALEACDGVAGEVPTRYAKKFEHFEQAIAKFDESLKKAKVESGDSEPPKKPEKRLEQNNAELKTLVNEPANKPQWGAVPKS